MSMQNFGRTIGAALCLSLMLVTAGLATETREAEPLRTALSDSVATGDTNGILDAGRALLQQYPDDHEHARAVALAFVQMPVADVPGHALEALAALNHALDLEPDSAALLAARGLFLLSADWPRIAFRDFERAAMAPDTGADLFTLLIDSSGSQEELLASKRIFTQRITENPEDVAALRARAETHYILNEISNALADLARLSQLDALEPADILLRYRLNLARTDPEAALEDLNAFLDMVPGDPTTLRLRAAMLLRLGRLEDAERDLSAARGEVTN